MCEPATSRMERGGAGGAKREQVHTSGPDQGYHLGIPAPHSLRGPAQGRELRAPQGVPVIGRLQPGRRQSGWHSPLGRWTGAEGSGTKTPHALQCDSGHS